MAEEVVKTSYAYGKCGNKKHIPQTAVKIIKGNTTNTGFAIWWLTNKC